MNSFLVAAVLFCNANHKAIEDRRKCVYDLGSCSAKFEREFEFFKEQIPAVEKNEKSLKAESEAQCFLFYGVDNHE